MGHPRDRRGRTRPAAGTSRPAPAATSRPRSPPCAYDVASAGDRLAADPRLVRRPRRPAPTTRCARTPPRCSAARSRSATSSAPRRAARDRSLRECWRAASLARRPRPPARWAATCLLRTASPRPSSQPRRRRARPPGPSAAPRPRRADVTTQDQSRPSGRDGSSDAHHDVARRIGRRDHGDGHAERFDAVAAAPSCSHSERRRGSVEMTTSWKSPSSSACLTDSNASALPARPST